MMTLFRKARRRLRHYALCCSVAAASVSLQVSASSAEDCWYAPDVCEAGGLCGWLDECPDLAPASCPCDLKANDPAPKQADQAEQHFLTVVEGDRLEIDTCNYDQWLASVGLPEAVDATPAKKAQSISTCDGSYRRVRNQRRRTEVNFNAALATLAASVGTGNPVAFGHWTEPFAMVGPSGSHLPEQIEEFESWVQRSLESAQDEVSSSLRSSIASRTISQYIPFVDFDGIVEGIAGTPEDTDEVGSLALVETTPSSARLKANMRRRLIGTSPVIITIEEAQALPIDEMVALQESLWPAALAASRFEPFCVRLHGILQEPNWSPLAKNTDNRREPATSPADKPLPAKTEVERQKPSEVLSGASERLFAAYGLGLTTVIEAQAWIENRTEALLVRSAATANDLVAASDFKVSLNSARHVGASVAALTGSGYAWVDSWTADLAKQMIVAKPWPPAQQQARKQRASGKKKSAPKQGAGEKLIARAEAVPRRLAESEDETNSAESVSDEELAEAIAQAWQWVDVARDAFDSFQSRLQDVTEVARNRGTQNASRRR